MTSSSNSVVDKIIYVVRDQSVMLDCDLSELYGVPTKVLNQAVSRNIDRFPSRYMFQLSRLEFESLRSQFVTFRNSTARRKYSPYVFTEHGVVMLSAILNSSRATKVSVMVVDEFVRLRSIIKSDYELSSRVDNLERGSDKLFRVVFERLDQLEAELPILPPKRKVTIQRDF